MQLKVVCIDNDVKITHEFSVVFDSELPEFGYIKVLHVYVHNNSESTVLILMLTFAYLIIQD